MDKQILAMGFPSARIMLLALTGHFVKEHSKIEEYRQKIEEICHIQEVGCLKIDYNENSAFIFLKECKKDHDLSKQVDKLKNQMDPEKWKKVLESLSAVILLVRNIYTSIYDHNLDLIGSIVAENDDVKKYRILQVDPSNTTLFLPNVDDRIGIFIENN